MTKEDVLRWAMLPLAELVSMAQAVQREAAGDRLELCSIMNAKSGSCAEDCKFCAQSGRYGTAAKNYPLKSKDEMVAMAERAKKIGAERFDIVTSGDRLSRRELEVIASAVREITQTLSIKMCASLGSMDEEDLLFLKAAGLTRYHHNLETSRRFFPRIVTTHSYDERIATVRAAKKAGLEVCSGGIIGLGETIEDRVDLAMLLDELDVDAVPLNILVPIAGTPLEARGQLPVEEALRAIALFRIILQDKIIKIAAGRESVLGDSQIEAFRAGADGMLIGGYLTIQGQGAERDRVLVEEIKKTVWTT